jgi:DNA-directed RNA polymerase subunit alpha
MAKAIHNPMLAEVKDLGQNSAVFTIKPLFYGYGNTLGNSLRRVLLSSIRGAAVTAFKVDGIDHEFTAIPGVKEDVVDIMQNLKGLRFHADNDEPYKVHVEKTNGALTGKDLKLPTGLTLANPDHIIAVIDDPKKKLSLDLIIEAGRGYQTIKESNANKTNPEFIALDAIFSPVLRVRYNVAETRVGQDTNLQQLELTIDTDGTIAPREAFEEAAAILINQYSALAGSTRVEATPTPGIKEDAGDSGLAAPIEDLGFSERTKNALLNNDIKKIRDLVALTESDLKKLHGFGVKALEEVNNKLKELEI